MMRSFLLCLGTIALILAVVHGQLSRATGDCPAGKQPGDKWSCEDSCGWCSCTNMGNVAAVGCALYQAGPDCYTVEGTEGADYPQCCESFLCRGDPGFDETLLPHVEAFP